MVRVLVFNLVEIQNTFIRTFIRSTYVRRCIYHERMKLAYTYCMISKKRKIKSVNIMEEVLELLSRVQIVLPPVCVVRRLRIVRPQSLKVRS